jgi:hypothetical protein
MTTNTKFQALLDTHQLVQLATAASMFGATLNIRARGEADLKKHRARMRELFADMSTDELIEFKAYRDAHMK